MFKSMIAVSALVLLHLVALQLGAGDAEACVALGHPSVKIKLEENSGTAIVTEYDCQMMVQKTFCIAGIRLSDTPATKGVKLTAMRFINLDDYSTVEGFDTQSNATTARAFAKMMGGQWSGFAGIYNAKINKHGGTAMEIKFTFAPGTDPKTIAAAFDHGHVGIGEGTASGAIAARGHHIEVIEIRGATIAT